jgi:hypothetical protein
MKKTDGTFAWVAVAYLAVGQLMAFGFWAYAALASQPFPSLAFLMLLFFGVSLVLILLAILMGDRGIGETWE